jgi:solute carrier family 35 protein E1
MATAAPPDANPKEVFKFPAFQHDLLPTHEEEPYGLTSRTPSPSRSQQPNGHAHNPDRWQPRREQRAGGHSSAHGPSTRHGRQKSLSEALRTIRTRKASVSQNAHELADALKAPVSPRLVVGRQVRN